MKKHPQNLGDIIQEHLLLTSRGQLGICWGPLDWRAELSPLCAHWLSHSKGLPQVSPHGNSKRQGRARLWNRRLGASTLALPLHSVGQSQAHGQVQAQRQRTLQGYMAKGANPGKVEDQGYICNQATIPPHPTNPHNLSIPP